MGGAKVRQTKRLDTVQLRDVLAALTSQTDKEPILEIAAGLLEQCQQRIEEQAYEIALLRKQAFGRRSEKVAVDQMSLFSDMLEAVTEKAGGGSDEPPKRRKKRKPQKRRPLVPTRFVELGVPEEERPCPDCKAPRATIGFEKSFVIEHVPARIDVIEYTREKIACKACEGELSRAELPNEKVIPQAAPGPGMLAALIVQKHVDGLPLHRTQRIFARSGVDLAVQTLNRWEGFGQALADPVTCRLGDLVKRVDLINLDDTGLRVRDGTSEHGAKRGHIWVFVGSKFDPGGDLTKTEEIVYYIYAPTWHAKYPDEFLSDYKGVLQGDGYAGYDRVAGTSRECPKNVLAGCTMHARRPFVHALEMGDPLAPFFVEAFREVYQIEAWAKQEQLCADDRLQVRREKSVPILNRMRERGAELATLPLSKPLQQGIGYLENQWEKLRVPFESDGRLEIDNGSAERRLRRLAAGRRAWLFAGAESGAHRIAEMLSLVSSAEAAGVDPGLYLTDIFKKIANGWPQRRLDDLLPHRWKNLDQEPA